MDDEVEDSVFIREVRHSFKSIDTDSSGFLSREEIRALLQKFNHNVPVSEDYLEQFMRDVDENKDNKISENELVSAMLKFSKKMQSPTGSKKRGHNSDIVSPDDIKERKMNNSLQNIFFQQYIEHDGIDKFDPTRDSAVTFDLWSLDFLEFTPQEKSARHTNTIKLLRDPYGKEVDVQLLSNSDNDVLKSLKFIRDVLEHSVVFSSPEDRWEQSTILKAIFDGMINPSSPDR